MDQLTSLRMFARICETGSFSVVAREFSVSQPTVSKAVAVLESQLGTQLIRRSPRTLSLTEAGERYYEVIGKTLAVLDAAAVEIGAGRVEPTGLLRLTASAGFGRLVIMPTLPDFLARHPKVSVEFTISDRFADLVEEGMDLAIRIGDLPDSRLMARKIGVSRRVTVASRVFLERQGRPRTPLDVPPSACIGFIFQRTLRDWPFRRYSEQVVVTPDPRLRANDAEMIRAAVLSDLGFASAPEWLFAQELRDGTVQRVLEDWDQGETPISAVYAGRQNPPGKVRAFIDHLGSYLARTEISRASPNGSFQNP